MSDLKRLDGSQGRTTARGQDDLFGGAQESTPAFSDGQSPVSIDATDQFIPPERLLVTPRGVVAFMGTPGPDGVVPYLVLRTPPWAVKDLFGKDVRLFMAAGSRLSIGTGERDADLEFPGFFGKFILKRQAHIALFSDDVPRERRVLDLSYRGTSWGVRQETIAASSPPGADVPDLHGEFAQLASPIPLEGEGGIWAFHPLEREGALEYERWRIVHLGNHRWRIFEDGASVGDVDLDAVPLFADGPPAFMEEIIEHPERSLPRHMALLQGIPMVVPLGSGSGFSPEEASSHLLVDGNGEVTVVDPNTRVLDDLARLGIPLARVKRVVVSHVHFDHVGGLWQLIRHAPGRLELVVHANPGDLEAIREGHEDEGEMSTLTAIASMAVHATKGKLTGRQLLNALDIIPIAFGEPMKLGTLTAQFFHGFHSIPAVGYALLHPETKETIFLFTGDTQFDPASFPDAMSVERQAFLSRLVPDALAAGAHVYADAGVQPLHPSVAYYQSLWTLFEAGGVSERVRREMKGRLSLFHAKRAEVEEAGFRYAGFGWGDAVSLAGGLGWIPPDPDAAADRAIEQGLRAVDAFANLSPREIAALKGSGQLVFFTPGDVLMREGDAADHLLVLLDGALGVMKMSGDQRISIATVTQGMVGEGALSGERYRNADVVAQTEGAVLMIGADAVIRLHDRRIVRELLRLREWRDAAAPTADRPGVLEEVDPSTRDDVLLSGEIVFFEDGETLIREGEWTKGIYIVLEGEVEVSTSDGMSRAMPLQFGRGAVMGEGASFSGGPRSATVEAVGPVSALFVNDEELSRLMQEHDDLYYHLLGLAQIRGITMWQMSTMSGPPEGGAGGNGSVDQSGPPEASFTEPSLSFGGIVDVGPAQEGVMPPPSDDSVHGSTFPLGPFDFSSSSVSSDPDLSFVPFVVPIAPVSIPH